MKTAVVYYSMNGNTRMVAEAVALALSADLTELKPEKAYPNKGIRKFLWGGKSAVMAETPKLEPYLFNSDLYDQVVFGFPVWAGNIAPPLRTFVQENRKSLEGKKIAAFACQAGSGGDKALKKLLECLGRDSFAAGLILIDPKDRPREENKQEIEAFAGRLG